MQLDRSSRKLPCVFIFATLCEKIAVMKILQLQMHRQMAQTFTGKLGSPVMAED